MLIVMAAALRLYHTDSIMQAHRLLLPVLIEYGNEKGWIEFDEVFVA